MMGARFDPLPPTPAALFWRRVAATPDLVALREKRHGLWRAITWRDYGAMARRVAHALATLGLRRGDVSSVLSENRPEWLYCDLGAQSLGVIGNGIYTTSAANQVAYILKDSRSGIVFVEDEEQLDKALAIREGCPDLRHIVVVAPALLDDDLHVGLVPRPDLDGAVERCQHDDPRILIVATNFLERANAIQLRHAQVEQRHIGMMLLPKIDCFAAIACLADYDHVCFASDE